MSDDKRLYDRLMLRSAIQSLFWNVILTRKQERGLTFAALGDALGISRAYLRRSLTNAPNWQIDKLADMADALGVDLIIEARDRSTNIVYTPSGKRDE